MSAEQWLKRVKIEIVKRAALGQCPIIGCSRKWATRWGIYGHLITHHKKNELVDTLLEVLGV